MEVKYVWRAPWNMGKVLYLVNHYLTWIDVPLYAYDQLAPYTSRSVCYFTFKWEAWSMLLRVTIGNVILGIRTWALWNNKSWWSLALAVLVASDFIASSIYFL